MSIANLFNVPGTQEELDSWAFAHMANHRDIIQTIYLRYGISLPEYALDPVPTESMEGWLSLHQQMHSDMNSFLGISSGLNLLNVDWEDTNSRAGWILANATEHRQVWDLIGEYGSITPPPAPTVLTSTFLDNAQSNASLVSYTFPGLTFGPESADRYLVACFSYFGGLNIASVTIGGVAATVLVSTPPIFTSGTAIAMALVPAGLTGSVTITFIGGSTGATVALYSITGKPIITASATGYTRAVVPSATLTIQQNGCAIAVAMKSGSTAVTAATWAGLTQDCSDAYAFPNFMRRSSASDNFSVFTPSLAASCTFTGGGATAPAVACFAIFDP